MQHAFQDIIGSLLSGDFDSAGKVARRLTLQNKKTGDDDALLAMTLELIVAYAQARQGKHDICRSTLDRALRIDVPLSGNLVDAWENAGVVCLLIGEWERALALFDRAREVIGRYAFRHPIGGLLTNLFHRTLTLKGLGRADEADTELTLLNALTHRLFGGFGPYVGVFEKAEGDTLPPAEFRVGMVPIHTPLPASPRASGAGPSPGHG